MKVKDLEVEEFKNLIQEAVQEKLDEVLGDPDQGLQLRKKVRDRLQRSLSTKTTGVPASELAKEMGLEW